MSYRPQSLAILAPRADAATLARIASALAKV